MPKIETIPPQGEIGDLELFTGPLIHAAYYVIPVDHPDFFTKCPDGQNPVPMRIRHQWGCVWCARWEVVGRVELIEPKLCVALDQLMGCTSDYLGRLTWPKLIATREHRPPIRSFTEQDNQHLQRFRDLLGEWPVVLGEALLKLDDGRYIVTENCD